MRQQFKSLRRRLQALASSHRFSHSKLPSSMQCSNHASVLPAYGCLQQGWLYVLIINSIQVNQLKIKIIRSNNYKRDEEFNSTFYNHCLIILSMQRCATCKSRRLHTFSLVISFLPRRQEWEGFSVFIQYPVHKMNNSYTYLHARNLVVLNQ